MSRGFVFLLSLLPFSLFAQVELSMTKVKLSESLPFIYQQILNKSFMIHPQVITDDREFSFYISSKVNTRDFLKTYLKNIGYGVYEHNGIDFIGKLPQENELVVTGSIIYDDKLVEAFIVGEPFGITTYSKLLEIATVDSITNCHFVVHYRDEIYNAICQ